LGKTCRHVGASAAGWGAGELMRKRAGNSWLASGRPRPGSNAESHRHRRENFNVDADDVVGRESGYSDGDMTSLEPTSKQVTPEEECGKELSGGGGVFCNNGVVSVNRSHKLFC